LKTYVVDVSSMMLVPGVQKALKPDKDGIYRKVPVTVINQASDNKNFYTPDSLMTSLTSPKSLFVRKLKAGQLEGEWGHPVETGNKVVDVLRMLHLEKSQVSHMFHRVYTDGTTTEQGNAILYGDLSCCGPYGKYLEESLQSPIKNTAFSIRTLSQVVNKVDGVYYKNVAILVTIDAVDAPGYAAASKVYIANEGMGIPMNPADFAPELSSLLGVESLNDQQLLDMLEVNQVQLGHTVHGVVDVRAGAIKTEAGDKSIFHEAFKRD
jgi:hypothetical protein